MMLHILVTTLGGLGLFILGMKMMTEGLQMAAGKRIKAILNAVSANRVVGCLTGAVVTAMVQSSSATTVMLIGFVTAGLLTLQQAVGMILGANVGTTVTAQLIAFDLTSLALPAVALGVVLKYFTQKKSLRYLGDVILGFGILFYGMTVMKDGLSPIKTEPEFLAFFTRFDPDSVTGLLLCVAVGAGVTIMVQSSSATVGLTMTLASQGLISFPGAMALVLGENIGTTITAELTTIGSSNINVHRAARAHTMFNVLGVCMIMCVFPLFLRVVEWGSTLMGAGPVGQSANIPRYLANGHTLFNLINACFFLCFLPALIKVAIFLSPREKEKDDFFHLPDFGERIIDTPIAAIAEARGEILRMAENTRYTFDKTIGCLKNRDLKELEKWREVENHIDDMQREILAYLTRIYQAEVSDSEARELSSLMRITNNIERVGDSVESIARLIEKLVEENLSFSEIAMNDLDRLVETVFQFMDLLISAMHRCPPDFMEQAEKLESAIDKMRGDFRDDHIQRLRSNECGIDQGLMYVNLLTTLEKIGDYCFNVAEGIAGRK